ncbi:hypothetical protein H9Q74_000832 [Fusarium xylarioides]|nr:hypothetical protein H9Q71_002308 [Fusarium xylarioides]KAG5829081.1 hypothetical protein H9Q74_000832 [Fusarium xylarioides]
MFDLDKDIEIDPLTNRVYLGEYHNLCFVFHAKPTYTCRVFIARIHKGLVSLSKEFPWVAGQVHYQGANKYKISPFQVIPRFQVENLPNIPTFDFSKKEHEDLPMHWINKNHVPIQEPLTDSKPSPVMELKFTLSQSASILTVSMNSRVVDRTGLIMTVRMLAEACARKLKKLPSSDVLTTEKHAAFFNIDKSLRHDRIPIRFVPDPQSFPSPSFEADIEWALFTFDRQAVRDIRDLVLKGRDSPSQCFVDVDTDQAFSAFVFRNICCARDDRLTSGWTARCFRAVDARNALGARTQTAKGKHLGALQHMTCNSYTNPSTMSIGRIATDLNKASSPSVLSQDVQHFLFNTGTAVGHPAFISDAIFNPAQDVAIVSWADVECKSSDFKLSPLWKVRCIRVPYHRPASEGLVYFMPRSAEDEMTVALSLRKTDLEKLLGLADWINRVKYDNH